MKRWRIASEEEILEGKTTDVYFDRTAQVLEAEDLNPVVHAEITVSGMPQDLEWGIVAGINDSLNLLEGKKVDVWGLPEGTLFYPRDTRGIRTPVLSIEGHYQEFVTLETPILGFLCHTSGMTSKTAQLRSKVPESLLLSYGARRTHPAITPQVSYAAFIGGCDGVSCVLGAEKLGLKPTGTMPHSLIIVFQDHVKAWKAFDRYLPKEVPRIALTDTYLDEVFESVLAAKRMPGIMGVRLDTTSSRRGDFRRIIQEVRWELDVRGFNDIEIFVSGGIDASTIRELVEAGADGFGVGGAISNATAIDFAMDITAMKDDGKWIPVAKRGKFSGRKRVWNCPQCHSVEVMEFQDSIDKCQNCGKKSKLLTEKLMETGRVLRAPQPVKRIRDHVISQIKELDD